MADQAMTCVPIISHHEPQVSNDQREAAIRLADALRQEHPKLAPRAPFEPLVLDRIIDAPTLHLDDLSGIPLMELRYDVPFLQERARLRAGDGDFVASCFQPTTSFEPYVRDVLGLGAPTWLHPRPVRSMLGVAAACWADRAVRRALVRAVRAGDLYHIHPHMGILDVWELGALLRASARRDVKIIAPPPGVTKWVNDKLSFAETVRRLLGEGAATRTEEAANFAVLSTRVRELAREYPRVVVKLPDSAGGGGTLVLEGAEFRHETLARNRRTLQALMREFDWRGETRLLIGGWESAVLCSPSSQLWIPPPDEGDPIVEGVFEQHLIGREQQFIGCRTARLPARVLASVVDGSWLLALVFQRLGYIGRCSFDQLVVGTEPDDAAVQFVECNGRWGGTSGPMTLMNRLFGDWRTQPYATRECIVSGLSRFVFAEVLDHFADDLYDARRETGWLVFYNPGRMRSHSGINALALADTWEEAERLVHEIVPRRLRLMTRGQLRSA